MIKHIVCFKLKNRNNSPKTKDVLLSMQGKVPQLRGIKVYLDQLHTARSFDLILEVLVDSWEELEAYQADAYHCDVVKKYVASVNDKSIALDFEV